MFGEEAYWFVVPLDVLLIIGLFFLFIIWLLGGGFVWIKTKLLEL